MPRVVKLPLALLFALTACRARQAPVPGRSAGQARAAQQEVPTLVPGMKEFVVTRGLTTRPDCLKISHVGNQDHPIGSIEICRGSQPRASEDPLRREWLFEVDAVTFDSIKDYLHRQPIPPPPSAGPIAFGTFLLTWGGRPPGRQVILVPAVACRILGGLGRVGSVRGYTRFAEAVSGLRMSVGCGDPPSPHGPAQSSTGH